MKQFIATVFLFLLYLQPASAQLNTALQPVYFIDSVRVSETDMARFNPNNFITVSLLRHCNNFTYT